MLIYSLYPRMHCNTVIIDSCYKIQNMIQALVALGIYTRDTYKHSKI